MSESCVVAMTVAPYIMSGDMSAASYRMVRGGRCLAVTRSSLVIMCSLRERDASARVRRVDRSVQRCPAACGDHFSDGVVNHGGSGSVIGALTHGLPMVVLPMGADQSLNADRCEQLGVGIALDVVQATPQSIREAVSTILDNPRYRLAAARIRDEIAAFPASSTVGPLPERLVGDEDGRC